MDDLRRRLGAVARHQRGLLTRADLQRIGVTRSQRLRLVRDATMLAVGCQTFEVVGSPPDERRTLLAACLDGGGAASHRSAAWLHGLKGFELGDPPEITTRRGGRSSSTPIARVHSTTWLPSDDLVVEDGIPCTSVARTLFGLSGLVPVIRVDQVGDAVEDAIAHRKASMGWLWWRLEQLRCRGRAGVALFEAILTAREGAMGTESWLEREFLRILADAHVEQPVCQARIEAEGAFVARVDFLYQRLGIIVEVTGAVAHASAVQRAADAKRRNRLGRAGYLVLEFTYEQVVREPAAVVAEVLAAMAQRHSDRRAS